MYKMKDVCRMTELPEKTVRFYVIQGLVRPTVESGLHYKAYRFSDEDIQRLREIAALREAEFSIQEIRQMLDDPNAIPEQVARRRSELESRIRIQKKALSSLEQLTAEEQTDVSQVADAIHPRSAKRRETPKSTRSRPLWLAVYLILFLILGFTVVRGRAVWILGAALLLLAGVSFPIMALGYFRYNRAYRKLPARAEGRIVSVISDEGTEEIWDPPLFGLLSFGFLHWNWIRPDHWVPLVQFESEGNTFTAAYRYGGMKTSWGVGDRVQVAWQPGKEAKIYPCSDPILFHKGIIYLTAGLAAQAAFAALVWIRF